MGTLAVWVGNLIAAVQTILGYLDGTSTDEKLGIILQALYDIKVDTFHIRASTNGPLGDEPYLTIKMNDLRTSLDYDPEQDPSLRSIVMGVDDKVDTTLGRLGSYSEGQTVLADLAAIYGRIAPGEVPPPPIATKADTALVMAGLYYIAAFVAGPRPNPTLALILSAIDDAQTTILEDSAGQSVAIESNQAANVISLESLLEYGLALSGDTAAIIELINALEPPVAEPSGLYPGLGNVTVGGTVNVTGATTINGPMDGLLISVGTIPPGQSVTATPGGKRYKGLGWVVFMTAQGEGEQLQKIETEKLVLLPKSIGTPASAEVHCKSGAAMSVKPFTINA